MKRNFVTGFIFGAIIFGMIGALAANYTAVENPFPIKLNNSNVNIEGYNINDSTYFKLRDIANVVGGFDVDFEDNTIILSTTDSKPIEETLTVATNAEYPPFEFVSDNGIVDNLDGIDIAIAKKISEKLGKELKIYDMEFDSVLPSVSQGIADMSIAGIIATDERKKYVDFSESYYTSSQIILVNNDNNDITSADVLKNGKKVGVLLGYTGDYYVTDDFDIPETNIIRSNNAKTLAQEVESGSLDAFVIDYEEGRMLAKEYGLKIIEDAEAFEKEEYAIAVKKGNTELLETVNRLIQEMKTSGELDDIISNYIK